jgi:hypothetical protein
MKTINDKITQFLQRHERTANIVSWLIAGLFIITAITLTLINVLK